MTCDDETAGLRLPPVRRREQRRGQSGDGVVARDERTAISTSLEAIGSAFELLGRRQTHGFAIPRAHP